ncbi:MAG: riboflavin kinase [Nocardioides sp.]|uniref:riboflavin kinase n=1 Tax=Nocardioides sp. TaxID=35761 RepID=UPI0039E5F627
MRETFVRPNPRPLATGPVQLIEGPVEHGDQRGRELGFPTANLTLEDHGAGDGVWVGTVVLEDGSIYAATVSVGRRVTFYGRDGIRLLEAYLHDFDGDLYGQNIRVWLHSRLRLQRRFPDVDSLIEQMHQDVADTRTWAGGKAWADVPGTRAMIDPLAGLA